jgi:hypothetical protein
MKIARRKEVLRTVCVVFVVSVIVFLADKGAQTATKTERVVFGGLAIIVT